MNGYGISQFQFIKSVVGVSDSSYLIVFDCYGAVIYLNDRSHISVKDSASAVYDDPVLAKYLPFQGIVVLCLHDLVAFSEDVVAVFLFLFLLIRRIYIFLQYPV